MRTTKFTRVGRYAWEVPHLSRAGAEQFLRSDLADEPFPRFVMRNTRTKSLDNRNCEVLSVMRRDGTFEHILLAIAGHSILTVESPLNNRRFDSVVRL